MKKQICTLLLAATLITFGREHHSQADETESHRSKSRAHNLRISKKVIDVQSGPDGKLSGFLVDRQGRPKGDQTVVLMQGRRVIGRTRTFENGRFQFRVNRGGKYQLYAANRTIPLRIWKAGGAPKSAQPKLTVVVGQRLVRGQTPEILSGGMSTPIVIGTAALIGLGTWGIIEAVDDTDRAPNTPN